MQTYRWMWRVVLMIAVVAWVGWGIPQALAQPARVPQTGQTECWDANGNLILCDGTGQDGDIQAGVGAPAARFSDRRDGTVRDNLTGLIWLKQANCFGGQLWTDALHLANTLHDSGTPDPTDDCGLSDRSAPGDWRLPNIKELQSLIDFSFSFPPLSNAAGTGQWAEGDAFFDVMVVGGQALYWSSTTFQDEKRFAWIITMANGSIGADPKEVVSRAVVWPVQGGD